MKISIFDVQHGGCALVTSSNGLHLLVDCGHNTSTNWHPSTYLPENGVSEIECLAITNYDEDHASDLVNLRQNVAIRSLMRNKKVEVSQIRQLKSEDGMGNGITELCKMINRYTGSSRGTQWGDFTLTSYSNSPTDFDDENNLSLALFIKHPSVTILFSGDLETKGWLKLLENQNFRNDLAEVDILIAPHHGRETGCCDDMFKFCNPKLTIISDKPKIHGTQETTPYYAYRSTGHLVNGENRKVLSTRKDGTITISTAYSGFNVRTSKTTASSLNNLGFTTNAYLEQLFARI